MVIFLTGATGYIGSAVAEALVRAGHSVLGLARSDEAAGQLHLRGIGTHHGDLASPGTLTSAAETSDAVIHAGSTNDGPVDQQAVGEMLQAVAGSDKPFVYTSGIWVLGDTGGRVADETWPVNPLALVAWRPAVERMVLDSARDQVRSIVIRPAVVYGRGGGIPSDFVQSARDYGATRYVGHGHNRWPVVHVDDLASLYLRALEQAPPGSLFHAADGSAHSVIEIAEAASFGGRAQGRTQSWPLEAARKTLGAYADALAADQQISAEKAKMALGWKPRPDGILDDLRSGSYAT